MLVCSKMIHEYGQICFVVLCVGRIKYYVCENVCVVARDKNLL